MARLEVKDGDIVRFERHGENLVGKVILHKGKPKIIWATQHACALSEARILSVLEHEKGGTRNERHAEGNN